MRDLRVASVQMESAAANFRTNFGKVERFRGTAPTGAARLPRVLPSRLLVPPTPHRAAARGAPRAPLKGRAVRGSWTWPRSTGSGRGGVAGGRGRRRLPQRLRRGHARTAARPPPQDPRLRAPRHEPGDEHTVFDTPRRCPRALLHDNDVVENVRIAALRGAEVLLAPAQTGGCREPAPRVIDHASGTSESRTRRRSSGSCEGRRAGPGSCAGCRAVPMTTACSSSSATVSASTTTRSLDRERHDVPGPLRPHPRGTQGTTRSSPISKPRSWRRPPGACGCRRARRLSTARSASPQGARDTHQLEE